MGEPYSTMIWVNRIEGLKSQLRIIATDCAGSDHGPSRPRRLHQGHEP